MNLDQVSNYFTLTAEIIVGILAFQGIATTFVFGRKGNWTYFDSWTFFMMIYLNLIGISVCIFIVSQIIFLTEEKEFWERSLNFGFVILFFSLLLFLYEIKKLKEKSITDTITKKEIETNLQKLFLILYCLIGFLPFLIPILYYNTNIINLDFIIYFMCLSPWIANLCSFSNFFTLIHHSLKVVK